jgi:hypothetical protein
MARNRYAASIRRVGRMVNANEFVRDWCLTPDVLSYSGCTFSRKLSRHFDMPSM